MKLFLDMISRIRVGVLVRKTFVKVKRSKFCLSILELLLKHGYICSYKILDHEVIVFLRYERGYSVFNDITVISTCRRKIFLQSKRMVRKNCGTIFSVLSTKQGIITYEQALERKIGGLFLFSIS